MRKLSEITLTEAMEIDSICQAFRARLSDLNIPAQYAKSVSKISRVPAQGLIHLYQCKNSDSELAREIKEYCDKIAAAVDDVVPALQGL